MSRENFSRRNLVKNSWNGPFSKKNSRKIIDISKMVQQNNLVNTNFETVNVPRKRLQPTQVFDKKRIPHPLYNEEEKHGSASRPLLEKAQLIEPLKAEQKMVSKNPIHITNIFEKSRTGYIPIGPETGYQAKSNQDAYMTIKSFCSVPGQCFLGVFDGHGFNGQKVSKFIKKKLPKNIRSR